jgi:hypothetical protein
MDWKKQIKHSLAVGGVKEALFLLEHAHEHRSFRSVAAEILARSGEGGIVALRDVFQDKNAPVQERCLALHTLVRAHLERHQELLDDALYDEDEKVCAVARRLVVQHVKRLPAEFLIDQAPHINIYRAMLRHPDPEAVRFVVEKLQSKGYGASEAFIALTRARYTSAIPEVITYFSYLAEKEDISSYRWDYCDSLRLYGKPIVEPLLTMLEKCYPKQEKSIIKILGSISHPMLTDLAICWLCQEKENASNDPKLKRFSSHWFAMRKHLRPAIRVVQRARATEAVPMLISLLEGGTERRMVAIALVDIGTNEGIRAVIHAATQYSYSGWKDMHDALAKIVPLPPEPFVDYYNELRKSLPTRRWWHWLLPPHLPFSKGEFYEHLLHCLGETKSIKAIAPLRETVEDLKLDINLRTKAVEAMSKIPHAQASVLLKAWCQDASDQICEAAKRGLGQRRMSTEK